MEHYSFSNKDINQNTIVMFSLVMIESPYVTAPTSTLCFGEKLKDF